MAEEVARKYRLKTTYCYNNQRRQSKYDIVGEESQAANTHEAHRYQVSMTVERNCVTVKYCCTENMIADIMTKSLPKPKFEQCSDVGNVHLVGVLRTVVLFNDSHYALN